MANSNAQPVKPAAGHRINAGHAFPGHASEREQQPAPADNAERPVPATGVARAYRVSSAGSFSRVSLRGFAVAYIRVIRPSSTTRLTTATWPLTSIRPASAPLSHTV